MESIQPIRERPQRVGAGAVRAFERTQVAGLQVGDRVRLDANSFHRV